jgi:hypothetical protein
LTDPFEQLNYDPSAIGSTVPVRTEDDLDRAERESRERYVNKIKTRYVDADVRRVVDSLKESVLQEAVIETSKGPVRRDPVCVYTRPIDDEVTCLAYAHTDEIINLYRKKVAVIDVGYNLATRKNVEIVFSALRPLCYTHCGHGTEEALLGQGYERIIDSANVDILQGCVVSTVACHSHNFARLAIDHGCVAFHGYKAQFKVLSDHTAAKLAFRILKDKETLTPSDFSSANGYVAEAMKAALIHDRDSMFLVGDTKARIASFGNINKQKYYELMAQRTS